MKGWIVDGVRAGRTKSAGGLTYATVDEAGHMVSSAFDDVRRKIAEDRAGTVRPSGTGFGNVESMVGGRGSLIQRLSAGCVAFDMNEPNDEVVCE